MVLEKALMCSYSLCCWISVHCKVFESMFVRHWVIQNSLYRYTVQIRCLFLGAIVEKGEGGGRNKLPLLIAYIWILRPDRKTNIEADGLQDLTDTVWVPASPADGTRVQHNRCSFLLHTFAVSSLTYSTTVIHTNCSVLGLRLVCLPSTVLWNGSEDVHTG